MHRVGQDRIYTLYTVYDDTPYMHCIFGDFPAKGTVHLPYIYGSGPPYTCREGDDDAPVAEPLMAGEANKPKVAGGTWEL
jgi:hypothetical protein